MKVFLQKLLQSLDKKFIVKFFLLLLICIPLTVVARRQFYHLLARSHTNPSLSIEPSSYTLEAKMPWKFSGVGGLPPYAYSVVGSGGSVDPVTGIYTPDAVGGYTVTVRVTDGASQTADSTVTVNAIPELTCPGGSWSSAYAGRIVDSGGAGGNYGNDETCQITIQYPPNLDINIQFSSFSTETSNDHLDIRDGNWSLLTSYSGSSVPTSQTYNQSTLTFEFFSDSATTDTGFDFTWNTPFPTSPVIMPATSNVHASEISYFSGYGGVGPYTFAIVSGLGTLSADSSISIAYIAPLVTTTATVRMTDSAGQTADATVTVYKDVLSIDRPGIGYALGDSISGGYNIGFSGAGFLQGMTATIGGIACPVTFTYSSGFGCTVPAGTEGLKNVTVTNPDTATFTLTDGFLYPYGTSTSMPIPSTAPRSHHSSIWTGDRWVIWSGFDPNCSFASCLKSDGFVYNQLTDSWSSMAASPLGGRVDAASVWTGHDVLIFGGRSGGSCNSDGAKYNAYTDTWTSIASAGWGCRQFFSQAWTGTELIVFGGQWGGVHGTGAAYNLAANSWRAIASATPRWAHQAIWTGKKMITMAGALDNGWTNLTPTGQIYDPSTDSWSAMADPDVYGRAGTTIYNPIDPLFLIWTGDKLIFTAGGDQQTFVENHTTGYYDVETNSWTYPTTQLSMGSGAPVWTGDSLVYATSNWTQPTVMNIQNDTYSYIQRSAFVEPQYGGSAIWTGQEVLICYGYGPTIDAECDRIRLGNQNNRLSAMSSDSWIGVSTSSAPSARTDSTTIWDGREMLVWGGYDGTSYLNTGYKYDPVTNIWTAISSTGAPSARKNHSAIWVGNRMVIWGGETSAGTYTNTGGIYNPYQDTWTSVSTSGAVPSARKDHSAIWTGGKMIVWGGYDGSYLGDGAALNVDTNTWSAVSATSAPTSRARHQALWTGDKMIIWGGADSSTFQDTGATYTPVGDSWSALSATSAPTSRADFSMVLSKNKFTVWGGVTSMGVALSSGGTYDLAGDTWSATTTTGAPAARSLQSTAYTDRHMIVWGGKDGGTNYSDAFEFDPQTNTWTALSSAGLSSRYNANAVWTGTIGDGRANGSNSYRNNTNGDTSRLIIWGGFDGTSYKDDGKIYNLPNQ